MKRLAVLAVVLAVFSAATAFAKVQDFGAYTVDVPAGWTATPDGNTVGIVKDDNSAAISITYDKLDGATVEKMADAYLEALGGKNPSVNGEIYTFTTTNANGVDSECYVYGDNKNYALIVVTGRENAPQEVGAILDSMNDK